MQKILYILRHAKAETGTATQEDFDRALDPRGVQAASMLASHLVKKRLRPELVWCSSAMRTRQTLMAMQEIFAPQLPSEFKDKMYNASAGEMLGMVATAPESLSSLMVIAHNPGIHQLALKCAATGDEKQLDTLAIKYPPATLAIVAWENKSWRDIAVSQGKLLDLITPASIGGVDD